MVDNDQSQDVEVLPSGFTMPPTQMASNVSSSVLPVPSTNPHSPSISPMVTYPTIPRLPMQNSAIALVRGEPGAGWCVLRDLVETAGVLAVAMALVGAKGNVIKSALAGAVVIEATVIAYSAAAIRVADSGNNL